MANLTRRNFLLSSLGIMGALSLTACKNEPENLDEPFEVTFQLPKSDDTSESFTYSVNQ